MEPGSQPAKLTEKQRQVVAAIKHLHREDEPLNITAIKRRRPELIEAAYAVKPFWGWKRAIEAAGLDYSRIRTDLADSVECRICGKELSFLPSHLWLAHQATVEDYLLDYPEADVVAEELRARQTPTLWRRKAQVPSDVISHWEPIWTPEYVLDRLWEYHGRGLPMDCANMHRADLTLAAMTDRHFGTYYGALRRLGLDVDRIRKHVEPLHLSCQDILAWIAARARAGNPLNYTAVVRGGPEGTRLLRAARREFKGWGNAVKAAGYRYRGIAQVRYLTKKAVIEAIRKRARAGSSLRLTQVCRGEKRDYSLQEAARRLFGNWQAALAAAGARYARLAASGGQYTDRPAVIAEIKRRYRAGLPLSGNAFAQGPTSNCALRHAIYRFFDSLSRAIAAAGLAAKVACRRLHKYPTRKSVMVELRRRIAAGIRTSVPSVANGSNMERDWQLYTSARGLFGSLGLALVAAGLDEAAMSLRGPRYRDRQSVIAAIRKRARAGLPLRRKAVCRGDGLDSALVVTASRLFGGWTEALVAAGLKNVAEEIRWATGPRYCDRGSVIAAIRKRARADLPLRRRAVCRGDGLDSALVVTASRLFGGWPRALAAAGFEQDATGEWRRRRRRRA